MFDTKENPSKGGLVASDATTSGGSPTDWTSLDLRRNLRLNDEVSRLLLAGSRDRLCLDVGHIYLVKEHEE